MVVVMVMVMVMVMVVVGVDVMDEAKAIPSYLYMCMV